MVWQQAPMTERPPRQGDWGPRPRRYVGETAVDGPFARDTHRPQVGTEVLPFVTYLTIRTSHP